MPLLLVALFIGIPILEVSVIDRVQEVLGWPYTLLILAADSILGAMLVRQEGTRAWPRFGRALTEGKAPTAEVMDGALILFGGALLLTPGFVTDIVGLACVLGPTRKLLNQLLISRFALAAGPLGALFMVGGDKGDKKERPERRRRGRGRRADDKKKRPAAPPPPGVIDVEVLDVRRNPRPGAGSGDDEE